MVFHPKWLTGFPENFGKVRCVSPKERFKVTPSWWCTYSSENNSGTDEGTNEYLFLTVCVRSKRPTLFAITWKSFLVNLKSCKKARSVKLSIWSTNPRSAISCLCRSYLFASFSFSANDLAAEISRSVYVTDENGNVVERFLVIVTRTRPNALLLCLFF